MMKTLMMAVVLTGVAATGAAWAQTKPPAADRRADVCKPIGKTEDGKLVYSMKCDAIPAPAPKAAMTAAPAAAPDAPAAEVEEDKGGLFGHAPSFVRPTTDQPRPAGVGPAQTR